MQKKYLLIKLRAMGDNILLTAFVEALIQIDPQAEIHILLPKHWAPIFFHNPHVKKIWTLKNNFKNKFFQFIYEKIIFPIKFIFTIRKVNYDYAIASNASTTTAFYSFLSGAKNRANNFHSARRKNQYSTVVIPGKGEQKSIIERDLDILKAFHFPIPTNLKTNIYISENEKKWALEHLSINKVKNSQKILLIGLSASRNTKIWPTEYFAEIIEKWVEEYSGFFIVIASDSEKNLVEKLKTQLSKKCQSIFLHTMGCSLRQSFSLISLGKLFIGNDSGPKHAAVALGVKTITLFGPEFPIEWHPYNTHEHPYLFIENMPCRTIHGRYCPLNDCTIEEHKCMRKIIPSNIKF